MVEVSLLEYLAMKMNCEYLSDLRYGPVRKKRLRIPFRPEVRAGAQEAAAVPAQ